MRQDYSRKVIIKVRSNWNSAESCTASGLIHSLFDPSFDLSQIVPRITVGCSNYFKHIILDAVKSDRPTRIPVHKPRLSSGTAREGRTHVLWNALLLSSTTVGQFRPKSSRHSWQACQQFSLLSIGFSITACACLSQHGLLDSLLSHCLPLSLSIVPNVTLCLRTSILSFVLVCCFLIIVSPTGHSSTAWLSAM